MNKDKIEKQLKETYPLIKWKVTKEVDKYHIQGSYTLRGANMIDVNLLDDAVAAEMIVDSVGEGFYSDLRRKVSNFEG